MRKYKNRRRLSMKNLGKKRFNNSYYIDEVVKYRSEYESGENFKNAYAPIVPELLLSLLFRVKALSFALCVFIGLLIFAIAKVL